MAGSGRVSAVFHGSVPNTNEPALGVDIEGTDIQFYIRPEAGKRTPEIGDPIKWGPHHATIAGVEYKKLSWELHMGDPLQ